jgi:two-component system glycerol uptake and utilization response regulator
LVVEDDPALLTFYLSVLRIAGYNVMTAYDGVDALRRIETDTPALVILDLGLPRLGGLDVHAELKSHAETRDIPIMVVSGTEASDLNPDDFACVMRKPVTAQALIEAVERCLRERR